MTAGSPPSSRPQVQGELRGRYLRHVAQEAQASGDTDEILNVLIQTNRNYCNPPLPDEEIAQIYRDTSGNWWHQADDPHRYDLQFRPAAATALTETIARLDDPATWALQLGGLLQYLSDGGSITIELPAQLDRRALQQIEGLGARVRPGTPELVDVIHVPLSADLADLLRSARDNLEPAPPDEDLNRVPDDALQRYQAALVQRIRGYLGHGQAETDVIETLIGEDFGEFFWPVRISDVLGAARDQVEREANLASLRNNPVLALTPAAIAESVANRVHEEMKYLSDLKTWRVWTGVRWEEDSAGVRVQERLKGCVNDLARTSLLGVMDSKIQAEISRAFKNILTNGGLRGLAELVARDRRISAHFADFDTDPFLLNLENGTLDLRTLSLRPHNPSDLITNLAGVGTDSDTGQTITARFDRQANCPLWKSCLEEWLPLDPDQPLHGDNIDSDTIRALQVRLGYCLSGAVPEDDFLIFYGARGRNGKGVVKDIVIAALGTYATVADRSLIVETREPAKGSSRGDLKGLIGKRLIFVDELKRSDRLDVQFVKDITGHGTIKFRPPYGADDVEMRPGGSLILLTNTLASVESADSIWDRLRIIPWIKRFEEDERRRDLRTALYRELPGILNWLLEGWQEYRRLGRLPESEAMRTARSDYQTETNPLADWVNDEMILANDPEVPAGLRHKIRTPRSQLYPTYRSWAIAQGYERDEYLKMGEFSDELVARYRGIVTGPRKISGTYYFVGICLRSEFERNKHTLL